MPKLFICVGQSNVPNQFAARTNAGGPTPNVQFLGTTALAPPQPDTPVSWIEYDPSTAVFRPDFDQDIPFLGYTRGRRGCAIGRAARLWSETYSEIVYVMQLFRGGTTIEDWSPGGLFYDDLLLRINQVFAMPEISSITAADIRVLYFQAEQNVAVGPTFPIPTLTPAQFSAKAQIWRDNLDSIMPVTGIVQYHYIDVIHSANYGTLTPPWSDAITNTPWNWQGIPQTTADGGPAVIFTDSFGGEYELPFDQVHYTGNWGHTLGERLFYDMRAPVTYQWQEYNTATEVWDALTNTGRVSGALTAALAVANCVLGDTGRRFRCAITNTVDTVLSAEVDLTVT